MMNNLIALAILLPLPGFAAHDPNLSHEGNRVIVTSEACLANGGKISSDYRYFVCEGGKYDGYITNDPASKVCAYKLKNAEYWEDASGTLTIDGKAIDCKTIVIGEDMVTLCQDKKRKGYFPYVVSFDGAEANFFVLNGISGESNEVCQGVAR